MAEIKYKGLRAQRLPHNPEERRFSEAWALENGRGQLLDYLLDTRTDHTAFPPPSSTRDHQVAATVIQWLGSPVGQSFLETLGYTRTPQDKQMKKPDKKILKLKVDPYQGAASIASAIRPPDGYVFASMDREGEDVTITYVKPHQTETKARKKAL